MAKYFEVFVENSQEKFKFFPCADRLLQRKSHILAMQGARGAAAPRMVRIFQFKNWDIHYKNEPQHGFREKILEFSCKF